MSLTLFLQMGLAVALGLLVGLQRERAKSQLAGIRTFPLIALFGVFCGALAERMGAWIVVGGLLGLAAFTVMANVIRLRKEDTDPGMTTEVAILVMFGIGVALTRDLILEAIVAGGGVALLLHWKTPLHGIAERIGARDFAALMRLVLIALVVLPVLPNRSFGPYDLLNPFEIWMIVVLIVGISMAGYVAFKLFGNRTGALAAGLLGGVISSTATTVGYARRSRSDSARSSAAALVITLASMVVFGRVIVEIAIVAPSILGATLPPLLAMIGVMAIISGALFRAGMGSEKVELDDQSPPSEIGPAIAFGVLYALILLAVAFAEDRFGTRGLYFVAGLSGLTDMDAITLSTAQLMTKGDLDIAVGWRMIMVGAIANLVFKGGIVFAFGSRELRRRLAGAFGFAVLGGSAIVLLWPD
jgi:uncharacterized membrane protein (DUF4010 family)